MKLITESMRMLYHLSQTCCTEQLWWKSRSIR